MALVAARLNAKSFSVVVIELVKCKIKFSGSKKFSRVVIGIVSFFPHLLGSWSPPVPLARDNSAL